MLVSYLFMELARNPDVRKKLLGTLPKLSICDRLINSISVRTDPTYDYLQACIQGRLPMVTSRPKIRCTMKCELTSIAIVENLRMHPIASEFGRRTLESAIVLDSYVIPPYTVVSASYRALHLNEDHWPHADRFWPERFLPEDHPCVTMHLLQSKSTSSQHFLSAARSH
jgi:cytochrome P450